MVEDREDRISYALDQALHSKPNSRKLSGNEMVHQIFVRFDKDVDFRLNDEEFIDFLKALDPNWKEHIVDIAWEVRLERDLSCRNLTAAIIFLFIYLYFQQNLIIYANKHCCPHTTFVYFYLSFTCVLLCVRWTNC